MEKNSLTRYAWLSILAAIVTIVLKTVGYKMTGSIGLLSEAVESLVNLVGGVMALTMLKIASRPADDEHAYGHSKAEYFSSGVEGTLILIAAIGIAWAAYGRLRAPQPLEKIGPGMVVMILSLAVNLGTALVLLRVGRQRGSITLEANAHHLLTDVWTSVGVISAIVAVALTGWSLFDPIIAIVVAGNIVWTGVNIVKRSIAGLMDTALSAKDMEQVKSTLERYREQGIQFHALRTRQAGSRKFVNVDVLVPGRWTVQEGHDFVEKIEEEIRTKVTSASVFTHLEPIEDPLSWADEKLDRPASPSPSAKP